ncbi:FAD/NAD(P)-binding protein [Gluconobacter cerinus]|uniref:FAD/NAD(P)-binding protein n=1 Tax=Gluconobacter cerinus TaxID=38307 RepID=UPI003AB2218C
MENPDPSCPVIVIIGSGASGTLLAWYLRKAGCAARLIVVGDAPEPGRGLAYGTPCLSHYLNVCASGMSAVTDDPSHFLAWVREHHDPEISASDFVPRAIYGRYLQSLWTEAAPEYHQGHVLACDKAYQGWNLTFADGACIAASYVVLATGNFSPVVLSDPRRLVPGYSPSAWQNDLYNRIGLDDDVALIGTGLTAVDVLVRLRQQGHRGQITAISRHGWYPTSHAEAPAAGVDDVWFATPPSARAYLALFRECLRKGISWRSMVNALRAHTNALWGRLPVEEKRRFARHLQRRWDIVRHRMAPALRSVLDQETEAGTLKTLKGRVEQVSAVSGGVRLSIQGAERLRCLDVDHAVNCTGPSRDYRTVGSALLTGLLETGWATQTPLGGLVCDDRGALQDASGRWSTSLYAIGPMRWGTVFETTAIPEIRQQAAELAYHLAAQVQSSSLQNSLADEG